MLHLWRKTSFNVTCAYTGSAFLFVEVFWHGSQSKMAFLNVYGPHDDDARKILWSDLLEAYAGSNYRWCLMDDFNVVRNASERKGSIFH